MASKLWLLAFLALSTAVVIRSPLLGGAAFIMAGSPLVAAWWTGRIERGLRLRHVVPETLSYGETSTVTLEVSNTSLLPVPWLQLTTSVPLMLRAAPPLRTAFALGAGGSRRMTYPIRGSRRGFYRVGPLRVATGDVLGLYLRQLNAPAAAVTVLPEILHLHALGLPAQAPFGPLTRRQQRGEDPARPAGVRPYQSSDGARRLDWKSSARHGELFVRRSEPSIAPETTLALCFRLEDYPSHVVKDSLERAAVVAASLAAALLARRLPVGLVTNGVDDKNPGAEVVLPTGKGDGHLGLLLTVLGRLSASKGSSIFELLAGIPLPWGGTLVLILADLDMELLVPIQTLKRRGQHVTLALLEPSPGGVALARGQGLLPLSVDRRGFPVVFGGA